MTGARKGDNETKYGQQQNYLSVINTIGMRVNPTIISPPYIENKQWILNFEIEYEDAMSLEMLLSDFDLVPFITNLTETKKFKECVFRTTGPDTNIFFEQVDK